MEESLEFIDSRAKLSTLVNLALRSLRIRKISIEQDSGVYEKMRTTINLLWVGRSGSCKSTMLQQIADAFPSNPRPKVFTNMTGAGLVGTIEDGEFITGAAWECLNKPLLIDEFKIDVNKAMLGSLDGLLQILEQGTYDKKIGKRCSRFEKKDGKYYCIADNGMISVKTRLCGIVATMRKLEASGSVATDALLSRCIPFYWTPSVNELQMIANGIPVYNAINPKILKEKVRDVTISCEDYRHINNFVFAYGLDPNLILRALGDCCRVFAIIGRHNDEFYKLICDLKQDFQIRHKEAREEIAKNAADERWHK